MDKNMGTQMKKETTEKEELANARIEDSRKRLAKVICQIEGLNQEIRYACESMEWNDEVAYLIDEAANKLGYALATLDTWHDDPEDGDGES